jgi:ATP-binding cassette subfamily B (MDR/TAP) protein 6
MIISNPFPPSYSVDEFIWSSPFVYGPCVLIITSLLVGLPRYLYNTQFVIQDQNAQTPLSTLAKLVICLCLIVITTFIADAIVIVSRAIIDQFWTSSVLAFYIGVSWLGWTLSLLALANETQSHHKWYWTQYLFWILAVSMETIVGWFWLMGVLRPEPGKYKGFKEPKQTDDLTCLYYRHSVYNL